MRLLLFKYRGGDNARWIPRTRWPRLRFSESYAVRISRICEFRVIMGIMTSLLGCCWSSTLRSRGNDYVKTLATLGFWLHHSPCSLGCWTNNTLAARSLSPKQPHWIQGDTFKLPSAKCPPFCLALSSLMGTDWAGIHQHQTNFGTGLACLHENIYALAKTSSFLLTWTISIYPSLSGSSTSVCCCQLGYFLHMYCLFTNKSSFTFPIWFLFIGYIWEVYRNRWLHKSDVFT